MFDFGSKILGTALNYSNLSYFGNLAKILVTEVTEIEEKIILKLEFLGLEAKGLDI